MAYCMRFAGHIESFGELVSGTATQGGAEGAEEGGGEGGGLVDVLSGRGAGLGVDWMGGQCGDGRA